MPSTRWGWGGQGDGPDEAPPGPGGHRVGRPRRALPLAGGRPAVPVDRVARAGDWLSGDRGGGLQLHRQPLAPQAAPAERPGRLLAHLTDLRGAPLGALRRRPSHGRAAPSECARRHRDRPRRPRNLTLARAMLLVMSRIASRLVALLLVLNLLSVPAAAQQTPIASLQALVAPFFAQLSALRGLPSAGSPPPVVVRSRSETRRFLDQELNRKYPPAQIQAEQKSMIAWGLAPPDFDLRAFFLDLGEERAAGRRGGEALVRERVPGASVEPIRRAVLSSP